MLIQPEELTGALVRELRKKHKLNITQLYGLIGFPGKSNARLNNIENRDSWKPGDREMVASALNQLEADLLPEQQWQRPIAGDVVIDEDEFDVEDSLAEIAPADDTYHHEPDPEPWKDQRISNGGESQYDSITPPVDLTDVDEDENEITIIAQKQDDLTREVTEQVARVSEVPLELLQPRLSLAAQAEQDNAFLVTNGQLKTVARCPRKWWLSWYRRLELRAVPLLGVRSTGTRIHRALERYYVPAGETPTNPRDALERVLIEDWTEVRKRAEEKELDEPALASLWKDFEKSASLERAMIEGYVEWLAETGVDSDLQVVASETVLTADLPVDGHRVRAAALIDTRVVRTTDDVSLFIDHKTVGDLKTPQVTLPMDSQMLHYHLLEWLNAEGDKRCDGALYNMLRRVKRTATANPPFYDRVEVRHNEQELENYRRHLESTSRRLLQMTMELDSGRDPHDVAPPNPTANCSWDCDFVAICTMFDDGSRVEDAITSLYHTIDPHARYDRDLTKGMEGQ